MIDQKTQSFAKNDANPMVSSTSSFTQLSMDTDELSISGDDQPADDNNPNASTSVTTHSFALYDALIDICQNNIKYFECDDTESGQRFLCAFRGIIDHINVARQFVTKFITFVHEYDFDEHTPANGYRSFINAMQSCINHCLKICKYITQNRSYLLFRKNMYMK